MKTLLSFLTVTTLSTSLASNVSGFESSNITNYINSGVPTVSKINNLDLDFITIVTLNNKVWASSIDRESSSKAGLYSSTDNTNFIKNPLNGTMRSMVSTKNGTLYLTQSTYLYTSTDQGQTFNMINPFKGAKDYIAVTSNDVFYLASNNYLYQSTDGVTFNNMFDFGDSSFIGKIVIAPNNTIYVLWEKEGNFYVSKSFDGGYHFTQIPNLNLVTDIVISNDNKVFIANNSLYESTDNGNNFYEVPNSNKIISSLTFTPDNILYFETLKSLWRLDSNNNIDKIWDFSEDLVTLSYASDGIIWIGTDHGLYKVSFI